MVHTLFRVHETTPEGYDEGEPSPLFKVNQVGYLPWAPKYGYLGAWLGAGLHSSVSPRLPHKPCDRPITPHLRTHITQEAQKASLSLHTHSPPAHLTAL